MILNDTKLLERIGFKPHEGQLAVLEAAKSKEVREIALSAGRRFGKSLLCAYLVLREVLKPNKKIWIVSVNYDLTQKVFSYLLQFISKIFDPKVIKVHSRPYPKLTLPNGSWVECRSAENPNGLLGEELDLLIIDEAAMMPPMIYDRYLLPTTTSRKGRTVFISTPFGQNWFYHKFLECTERDDGASFNFPSNVNPSFPKEEWERMMELMPEAVFKQEHLASFLPDAAGVFRGVTEVIRDDILEDVKAGGRYVMGVDLGKHNDFSVLSVFDMATNKLVYFDRFNKIDYPLQKARIMAAAQRYNNARIIIDSTGLGDPISDDIQREGFIVDDYKLTNKSKKNIIDKLSIFIEQKRITLPNIPELINELQAFGYTMTDAGNVKYSAPQGLHDDIVISLALGVWGLTTVTEEGNALGEALKQRYFGQGRQTYF
jgi:hypothetical protein